MGVLIEKTTVVHRLEKNGTASPGLVYEAFVPVIPPKKTLWQLMYSRKSGKILGRTPRNWGDNSYSVNRLSFRRVIFRRAFDLLYDFHDHFGSFVRHLHEILADELPGENAKISPRRVAYRQQSWCSFPSDLT